MARARLLAWAMLLGEAVRPTRALCPSCEVVVGAVRVQALSPTLLRVEPRGPLGFENRPTFMVANRSFAGVEVSARPAAGGASNITTRHYSVMLHHNGSFSVRDAAGGRIVYRAPATTNTTNATTNLLHWPAPLAAEAYAIEDRPRFVPPGWAPEPAPTGTAPSLQPTSGYDFQNRVGGDLYIFLLGGSLGEWWASREEFLRLTGPTPLLPDYAYGTWFTRWHQYTEAEVKAEVGRWDAGGFPLDIFGLDMNWRRTNGSIVGALSCHSQNATDTTCEDHRYLVNTTEFPQAPHTKPLRAYLQWMSDRGLHTYLNDHPFPRDRATTPNETAFRWDSLTDFLERGLSFWWFDHGWIFTIPPPFVATNDMSSYGKYPGPWEGLTSEVWGSHVYYDTMKRFNSASNQRRPARPLALSRNGGTNWRPGMSNTIVNGVAAHHRYPVWWNGDGVPIMGSTSSMVDEAVHDLRPFVHSDCGAGETNATAVLRWTAHCVLGTILRFHGADHSPWRFDNATQAVIRKYLEMRYALAPSLIAAGRTAQKGLPLAARCDLFWPAHHAARSNTQYMSTFAEALVAPLNETQMTRSVWIPPGEWQEAWGGESVVGPRTINVTKPWSQIPMWHRVGALVITTDSKARRIAEQNWQRLTIHAWPATTASNASRDLYFDDSHMSVTLRSDGRGGIRVHGTAGPTARAWLLRLHLAQHQRLSGAIVDGATPVSPARNVEPGRDCAAAHFPFAGAGATPACAAGATVEIEIQAGDSDWSVRATMSRADVGGARIKTVSVYRFDSFGLESLRCIMKCAACCTVFSWIQCLSLEFKVKRCSEAILNIRPGLRG